MSHREQTLLEKLENERTMKSAICATALVLSSLTTLPIHADKASDLTDRLNDATQVIQEIESTPDSGIPDAIMSKATCVAVIPSVKKAAFIVGASYGQGAVTCRTGHGWSAPVFIRLAGGSVGFQIGGQATDLVLVAVNQKGFQDLLHSKFKIGAGASAAAGPVGRNATANTDILLNAELLSYSRAKGLFAGVDLNGATISQNTSDTKDFYGSKYTSYRSILGGHVGTPEPAKAFVGTVAKYFHSTK